MKRAVVELVSAALVLVLVTASVGLCAGTGETDGAGIAKGNGFFEGREGVSLYYQYWRVEEPKAIMILVHGFGEHSDRYDEVAKHFCGEGISCYALDHRGHGRSGGPRWNVENFDYFVDDLHKFVQLVKEGEGLNRYFMLGHSLGGEIALKYAIVHPEEIDGLIVSGPAVGGYQSVPLLGRMAVPLPMMRLLVPLLGLGERLLPDMGMPGSKIDPSLLNHDENNTRAYAEDPMVCHEPMKLGITAELSKNIVWLQDHASELQVPSLILTGGGDVLVPTEAVEDFYNKVEIPDKEFIRYDGFYHEILNEPESYKGGKERVLGDIDSWLLPRI